MSATVEEAVTPLAEVGSALAGAGVPALVLSKPPGVPHVELLLARGSARPAESALARVGWRWRVSGDGPWRFARRRRYAFDGGFLVTVHHALPTGPLPALALRSLERALWAGAERSDDDGLLRAGDAPLLVYLCVQAARGGVRSTAERAELQARAERLTDREPAVSLARTVGVKAPLRGALGGAGSPPAAGRATRGAVPAIAWWAARGLRERGKRQALAAALLGEPWRHAITRCRFDGLELLAGPGTFLPRRVSEQLVPAACERLSAVERPVAVDVGTGCGAIALALARRAPRARVLGVDVDERALTWAQRNGRRLGMPHVRFACGSLLDPVPADVRTRVSLIAANVPCVPPDSLERNLDAPARAYAGADPDGLGLQRRLAADCRPLLHPGGWLLVQLAPSQWPAYRETLRDLGFEALDVQGGPTAIVAAGRWAGP